MKSEYKIFMVGNSRNYAKWFPLPFEFTNKKEEADIAWWIGGADVNPSIYNEKRGPRVYVDEEASRYELSMWNYFKDRKNVLKIGVCKGSQNLAAFNGGKVVQHMRHPSHHYLLTKEGLVKENLIEEVVSTHHNQMIVDEKVTGLKENEDYELVAWTDRLSPFHLNGEDNDYQFPADYREPEIVFFPKTKSLAIQTHPEMHDSKDEIVKVCQRLVVEKLLH